ncbi:MAG TPA: Dabb family protein [Hanamia sp.]|nr:Dabb family protein [Hanamia sp.]
MKKIFTVVVLAVAFFFYAQAAEAQNSSALFRHTVIITFKHGAASDSIQALDKLYSTLSKNAVVKNFEWGVNISPRDSGVVKHIYVTTFASREDLNLYRKIPLYASLFPLSLAIADDVSVVDYWVEK